MKSGQFHEVLEDGRWAFRLDNHRLATFAQCETKFNLAHLENLRQKGTGGFALMIGSWWSRTMELAYREISLGSNPSLEEVWRFAGDAWVELDCNKLEERQKQWDKFGGREGAMLMAKEYYDRYLAMDAKNWIIVGAEIGFGMGKDFMVGENDKVVVYWTGKPDLFIIDKEQEMLLPVDHKTVDLIKSDISTKWKPHPQTAGYIYIGNLLAERMGLTKPVDRCIINVAARSAPSEKPRDGVKKPRFTRVYPAYSRAELDEWAQEILTKTTRMRSSMESGVFTRNESACHLYAGCQYRGICSVAPGSRRIIKEADFVQVEPWSPYEDEGDE